MLHPFSVRRSQRWRLPVALLGVLLLAVLGGTAWTAAATPDLLVSTTDNVDTVLPGDTITYRVAVRNNRTSGAAITVNKIVSTLDSNVVFEEASDGGVYDVGTHTVTWEPATAISLNPNRFTYRYVTVTVVSPLAANTQIESGAMAWESGDPSAAEALLDVDTVANVAPDAQDATRTTPEDVALVLDLATLVTDPNGDALTFTITVPPTQGTLTQSGSSVTYTPAPNDSGTYTFTFGVADNQGGSDTATVTITVTPANDAPVTTADSTSTLEDTPVSVPAATLLANDSDVEGSALSVTGFPTTSANGGTVVLSAGDVVYTPAPNFNGTDTVTYGVTDGGDTTPATLTIAVGAVNDAPSFTSGGDVNVAEDSGPYSAPWASALSAGPTADEAGQSLSFAVVSNTNPTLFSAQPALSPSGVLSFTPMANGFGSATVGVRLQDDGGTAGGGSDTSAIQSFTITVAPAQDAPTAQNQSVTVPSGQPLQIDVLNGASDPDNDSLTVSAVTQPANGTVVVDAPPTTVTFTSTPGFEGTTTFTFTLSDGNGGTATATVTVTVTHLNNKPAVIDHSYTTNEDVDLIIGSSTGALSGATDADGDSLSYVWVSDPAHGALSWYPNGGFAYYPDDNWFGTDTFTFRASDGTDTSNLGTITITVASRNDGPTLSGAGNVTVLEDAPAYSAPWFTNQSPGPADESGQAVTRTISNNNATLFSQQPALADDGTLTFAPAADAFGQSTVTLQLKDDGGVANGGSDTTTYTFKITVNPVNDAPSYTKGADVTVAEDSGAYSAAWASAITVGPANESAQTPSFIVTSTSTELFAVQPGITSNGTLLFTPAPDANGVAMVTAVLQDGGGTDNGGQDRFTATFMITITPVNDSPVANSDAVTALRDRTTTILFGTLLRNDSDPDGDALTITAVSAASGAASIVNGSIEYTPPAGFVGDATLTYTLSDGAGGTDTGTVTITVQASYSVFMPQIVSKPSTTPPPVLTPDLVGSFTVSPAGTVFDADDPVQITATITNQGTAAAGAFWVDLYINPSTPPTTTNVAWNTVCSLKPCQGLAWYVAGGLQPGQSITLTSTAGSYMSSYSIWSGRFAPGTSDLYLYVDSWNPGVASGGVAESDEQNNRSELHALTVTGTSAQDDAPDAATLPKRPAVPSR